MEFGILLAGLGMWEIILIVLVILLFFGAKRIPDLMKSLGKGVRSFKEGMANIEKEIKTDIPAEKDQEKEKENKD
jgi:sec-independent protein translocase protein TatA